METREKEAKNLMLSLLYMTAFTFLITDELREETLLATFLFTVYVTLQLGKILFDLCYPEMRPISYLLRWLALYASFLLLYELSRIWLRFILA
jgi:hypothetical protein